MNAAQNRTKTLRDGPGLGNHAAHGANDIDNFYLTGTITDTEVAGGTGKQDIIGFISFHAQLTHPDEFPDVKRGSFHHTSPGAKAGAESALHTMI